MEAHFLEQIWRSLRLQALSSDLEVPKEMSINFTIYATSLTEITVEDEKKYAFETWVVDDFVFYQMNENPIAMACLVTLDQAKEKFPIGLKHKEAEFLVVIKKSVDDMATEHDIENLQIHELFHFHLGHGGKVSTPEFEKQVEEAMGDEREMELHTFGLSWMMIQGKKLGPWWMTK